MSGQDVTAGTHYIHVLNYIHSLEKTVDKVLRWHHVCRFLFAAWLTPRLELNAQALLIFARWDIHSDLLTVHLCPKKTLWGKVQRYCESEQKSRMHWTDRRTVRKHNRSRGSGSATKRTWALIKTCECDKRQTWLTVNQNTAVACSTGKQWRRG